MPVPWSGLAESKCKFICSFASFCQASFHRLLLFGIVASTVWGYPSSQPYHEDLFSYTDLCQSNVWEIPVQCCFNLHFSRYKWSLIFLMYLSTIFKILCVCGFLLMSFSHFSVRIFVSLFLRVCLSAAREFSLLFVISFLNSFFWWINCFLTFFFFNSVFLYEKLKNCTVTFFKLSSLVARSESRLESFSPTLRLREHSL